MRLLLDSFFLFYFICIFFCVALFRLFLYSPLGRHLRFVRQECDVDLFEGFDLFSGERLADFIEQLLRAYWPCASMNSF